MVALIIATKVNAKSHCYKCPRLEKYDCPMRGVELFGERMVRDVETRVGMQKHWTIIKKVKSWYMCGYLCKLTPDCKYWNWKENFPYECEMLKANPGREYSKTITNGYGTVISGNENCF